MGLTQRVHQGKRNISENYLGQYWLAIHFFGFYFVVSGFLP